MFVNGSRLIILRGIWADSEWPKWVNTAKYYNFMVRCGITWILKCHIPIIVNAVKNGQDHHPSGHKNRFWMTRFGQFSKVFSFLIPCGTPWWLKCRMPIIVNATKNDQIHHPPEAPEPVLSGQVGSILQSFIFLDSCWNSMKFDMSHASNCQCFQVGSNS